MINAAHFLLYSADAAADRAFFQDVLGFPGVDAGQGWMILAFPPSELGVHPLMEGTPAPTGMAHAELYLMTPDIAAAVKSLQSKKVACTPPQNMGWGTLSVLDLPSGAKIGIYQPHHPVAAGMKAKPPAGSKKEAAAKRASAKKPAAKASAARQAAVKKSAATKTTAAKKPAAKKASPQGHAVAKRSPAKGPAVRKTASKRTPTKPVAKRGKAK
ncbi:MAG: VOC family protein [bacterium]